MKARDRLRIAIQKSGRLADPARELLARIGLSFRESRDRLFCYGESLPIDLLLVRDDDIPGLIAEGTCDLGIVGRNVLAEQAENRRAAGQAEAYRELRTLGFGSCRLSIAVPQDDAGQPASALAGKRIATSYPGLLEAWLRERAIDAEVVLLSGSVEIAPRLGKAEAICDLVSTGGTLAANQLVESEIVFESEAVLAGPPDGFGDERAGLAALFLRRLDGVLRVRDSKLVMLQAPRTALPALIGMLPDAEPPTLTRIDGDADDVALQAICRSAVTWQHLEDMKRAGARGLLVLPVERMLA
ncbi:ATP phosphoribosyltransferase [Coralloluteibacterium stylophorae]|uniref:ATP phosphoribosyltransferase n=1 Tax=Coralloluteibacterium stylophorae TaxID=1776034 RepID=A0A8J7VUC0_9GAMM|nr:ATP phosphoribosyltransferase [Coralloluteibacterium stylophorae]MBS7455890.1 ATP phosphoribosyltransferase [Coralloluteibacterium stylophorae]